MEDVAAKCDKLAGFLFSQFLDKPHNLAFWRKTHLYRWLKSNHEVILAPLSIGSPLTNVGGRSYMIKSGLPFIALFPSNKCP